jgi:hypothetical protein
MQESYTLLEIVRATGLGWNESEFPLAAEKFYETLDRWGIRYSPDVKGREPGKRITAETLQRLTGDMQRILEAIEGGQRTELKAHAPVMRGFINGLRKMLE